MMNRVVQIDLGKYPVKLVLAVAVFFLTVISATGEKSHAIELNKLPRNRTELTSIKSTNIISEDNLVTLEMKIDCIYPITLQQHFKFLKLRLSGDGYNITMNTSDTVRASANSRDLSATFDPPVNGDIRAEMLRSSTVLNASEIEMKHTTRRNDRTEISTSGRFSTGRSVNLSNVCWNGNKFLYFSNATWALEDPLAKFSTGTVVSGRRGFTHTYNNYITQKKPGRVLSGNTLVVDLPVFDPLNWNDITEIAAPLANILQSDHYETVLTLRDTEIGYLKGFGNIVPLSSTVCTDSVILRHLRKSRDAIQLFIQKMRAEMKQQNLLVILDSNTSLLKVANIESLAKSVCSECELQKIVVENATHEYITRTLASAKYIIAPHSKAVSQVIWSYGTLIELIPDGSECSSWTFDASAAAGVKHLRFAVGTATKLAPSDPECASRVLPALYNVTIEVDVDVIVSELNK